MAAVNFRTNPNDLRVAVLGSLGFGTDYISRQTKLSPGQVLYRLKKAAVRRSDYRNGAGEAARLALAGTRDRLAAMLRERLGGPA